MGEDVCIALAQMKCKTGNKKHNIEKIKRLVKRGKREKAHLIIFPELVTTGYITRDITYELAERIPGPSVDELENVASKENISIVLGMLEKGEKAQGVVYNTAVLIGPEGYIGKYRKAYLPTHSVFEEKRYFRLGYETPVFNTSLGQIGLIICYDLFFPELSRILRLKGAKLIICISASPAVRRKFFEAFTVSRAIENTVFLAYVNRVGIENGVNFWGGSRLIAPNGSTIIQSKYDEEDLVVGNINYGDMLSVETFVPLLRDLRPEFFDTLKKAAIKF